jgi:arsenate reductase (thioredoxin)
MSKGKAVVLFLCTGNSARSQMAEAILRHHAGDRFEACSAGLSPTQVHPLTLRVLGERGIDTSQLYAKPVSDFLGKASVRHAIVVCERAQEHCPRVFPFSTQTLYWPFDDPAAFDGSEPERVAKFREVRDQIDRRITQWLEAADQS